MDCKSVVQNIPLYFENKLAEGDMQEFQSHLKSCAECTTEVNAHKMIFNESSKLEKKQAPDYLWQRIEVELDAQSTNLWQTFVQRIFAVFEGIKLGLQVPAPAFKIVSAVAILFIGIMLGRYFMPALEQKPPTFSELKDMKYELVSERTTKYIEKSKVLFLGVINADAEHIKNADWAPERNLAANLVQEAVFLKDNISEKENARLRMLIEELELILLEIANMEEKQDLQNIELIKSGIDQKGLMLKINLHDLSESNASADKESVL